jgi:putative phage-type endonuclease
MRTPQQHLHFIKNIPQFEQRSAEWFDQRGGKLTASDVATALGINPYRTPDELLFDKCGCKRANFGNESTVHGQTYENEALNVYAKIMGYEIHTVGMISFSDLNPIRQNTRYNDEMYRFLGGSADGIAVERDSTGAITKLIMLEVKCPLRRKIVHGKIPDYYHTQVQLNQFILDIDTADYIEYVPPINGKRSEMNIVRVYRDEAWFDKAFESLQTFWNNYLSWKTRDITSHPSYYKVFKPHTYMFIDEE